MIDIAFAIIMIIACIKGFRKGLIISLFSIIAYIIGLAAALKLSAVVGNWLNVNSKISSQWLPFLSFALVFLIVVLLVNWGGKLVEKTFKLALLGWVNKLGGIVFFATLYTIIFSVFLFFATKIHLIDDAAIQSSQTYKFIQPWGPFVIDSIGKIVPLFKDLFAQLETFFSKVGTKIQH